MRLLVAWTALWPEAWAFAFGRALGGLGYHLGIRRRIAREGVARAFPDWSPEAREACVRAHYAHLGQSAVEFFRAPSWTAAQLEARIDPAGWPVFEQARAEGKGVIVAVAHLGNFEVLAGYGPARGVPLTAVTRALKGRWNAAWMAVRGELGVKELQGKNVVRAMLEVLRRREPLAVIIDQNMLPKRAVFAPFFGALAATTPAPFVLAERTGAPVILAGMLRQQDGRFVLHVKGPFHPGPGDGPEAFMGMLNRELEALIRLAPAQWFWVHRRWKTRPPGAATETT